MSVNDYKKSQTTTIFEVMRGPSENSATFIFGNEDHTLGNSLRHVLMQRPETEFCGYSVPHPYEPKMNVRLQTVDQGNYRSDPEAPVTSVEVMRAGLEDMSSICDLLDDSFDNALNKFKNR